MAEDLASLHGTSEDDIKVMPRKKLKEMMEAFQDPYSDSMTSLTIVFVLV